MSENYYHQDDFIGRWIAGTLTDEEKKEFELWLKSNSHQQEFFNELTKIHWSQKSLEIPKAPTERMWSAIAEATTSKQVSRSWIRNTTQWAAAIAASIVIYFGLESQFAYREITTSKAQQTEIVLSDGSIARLNGLSSIRYNSWRWPLTRSVTMHGEVYFEVQKMKRPFNVTAENLNVEVLGTKFNVKDRADRSEVVCSSGKVRVSTRNNSENTILTPGLAVSMHRGHFSMPYSMDTTLVAGWSQGIWNYQSAPIYSILNDWKITYGLTITMDSIDTKRTFTGLIHGSSSLSALKQLGLSAGFETTIVNDSTFFLKLKK